MSDSDSSSGSEESLCRVIGLIDVDSFECQIWQRKFPQFYGRPCVVADGGGRIVSVTKEAKDRGITRNHRVQEARRLCNHVHVFFKPNTFNKPDSSEPRKISLEIQYTIFKFCRKKKITVERVPNDEWYLDLGKCVDKRIAKAVEHGNDPIPEFDEDEDTVYLESSKRLNINKLHKKLQWLGRKFPYYTEEEQRLVIGAGIVNELLHHLYDETDFICSAGVSYNKLLAKQACKLHKPDALTILSRFGVERVSKVIPVREIHGLGSTFGDKVSDNLPHVNTMWDLRQLNVNAFIQCGFDCDEVVRLICLASGICVEDVVPKLTSDSVNCGKNNLCVNNNSQLHYWLQSLSEELIFRLREEFTFFKRKPNALKLRFSYCYEDEEDDSEATIDRTFEYYENANASSIAQKCFMELREWGFCPYNNDDGTIITQLTISAKNFTRYK